MAMTANEMVRDLIDNHGHTRYGLAKQGMCSETMVRQLYSGERGRYIRIETLAQVKAVYKRLKREVKKAAKCAALQNECDKVK